ncbi:MAG TPA: radical SAM protein, partial [Lachnospiraceae bacterium]|nr:radical SAM protein [Lachnospiraceae bacterium]
MIQPKTTKKFSKNEMAIVAKAAKNMSIVQKGLKENIEFSTELPLIVGFKLTNRCNLRCKTCYEWNEQGYHHNMSEQM